MDEQENDTNSHNEKYHNDGVIHQLAWSSRVPANKNNCLGKQQGILRQPKHAANSVRSGVVGNVVADNSSRATISAWPKTISNSRTNPSSFATEKEITMSSIPWTSSQHVVASSNNTRALSSVDCEHVGVAAISFQSSLDPDSTAFIPRNFASSASACDESKSCANSEDIAKQHDTNIENESHTIDDGFVTIKSRHQLKEYGVLRSVTQETSKGKTFTTKVGGNTSGNNNKLPGSKRTIRDEGRYHRSATKHDIVKATSKAEDIASQSKPLNNIEDKRISQVEDRNTPVYKILKKSEVVATTPTNNKNQAHSRLPRQQQPQTVSQPKQKPKYSQLNLSDLIVVPSEKSKAKKGKKIIQKDKLTPLENVDRISANKPTSIKPSLLISEEFPPLSIAEPHGSAAASQSALKAITTPSNQNKSSSSSANKATKSENPVSTEEYKDTAIETSSKPENDKKKKHRKKKASKALSQISVINTSSKTMPDPLSAHNNVQRLQIMAQLRDKRTDPGDATFPTISIKKGKQRLGPRTKHLTTLKKRVLQERLQKYKESRAHISKTEVNDATQDIPNASTDNNLQLVGPKSRSCTVCLLNFLSGDEDLEDEEEFEEILAEVCNLCLQIGAVENIFIPRNCCEEPYGGLVFVTFNKHYDALTARHCWNGMVLGGIPLATCLVTNISRIKKNDVIADIELAVALYNVLTDDDRDDQESLQETLDDVKDTLKVHGEVHKALMVQLETNPSISSTSYCIIATFCDNSLEKLSAAIMALDAVLLGGSTVYAELALEIPACNVNIPPSLSMVPRYDSQSTDAANKTLCSLEPSDGTIVVLKNVISIDDLEDEDSFQEAKDDIMSIMEKYGEILSLDVLREGSQTGQVFVTYRDHLTAQNALEALSNTVVGGAQVEATIVDKMPSASRTHFSCDLDQMNVFIVEVLLPHFDVFDEEKCLDQLNIILRSDNGVESSSILLDTCSQGQEHGAVEVPFIDFSCAKMFVSKLQGKFLEGTAIKVRLVEDLCRENSETYKHDIGQLYLANIFTESELDDDECIEECLDDLRGIVSRFGDLKHFELLSSGFRRGSVRFSYIDGLNVARSARDGLRNLVLGGQSLNARFTNEWPEFFPKLTPLNTTNKLSIPPRVSKEVKPEAPQEPMLTASGKIISKRWAECKRVPKIPNSVPSRSYAAKLNDPEALPLLTEMLGKLMQFQIKSKDDSNARARRRLVMGFREAARGLRANKVKMVVMANNLDEYGAIDGKTEEILQLCRDKEIPTFFEFNKRTLGKALGKSIKIGIVAVQNADGAHEEFKKLKKILAKESPC